MICDLSNPHERSQAIAKFKYWLTKGKRIELRPAPAKKTVPQLRYIHLAIKAFGNYCGYDPQEMKQVIKRDLLPEFFQYEKNGRVLYRSLADFEKDEASALIDKLVRTASQMGYYIPPPTQPEYVAYLEQEAQRLYQ